jgi:presenilin-like A22 family membrane protease
MPRTVAQLPTMGRYAVLGAVGGGLLGGLAGLVVGLVVYAPTAWAATVELGLPMAGLGAVLGFGVGAAVLASRRSASPEAKPATRRPPD